MSLSKVAGDRAAANASNKGKRPATRSHFGIKKPSQKALSTSLFEKNIRKSVQKLGNVRPLTDATERLKAAYDKYAESRALVVAPDSRLHGDSPRGPCGGEPAAEPPAAPESTSAENILGPMDELVALEADMPRLKFLVRTNYWYQSKELTEALLDLIVKAVRASNKAPISDRMRRLYFSRIKMEYRKCNYVRNRSFVRSFVKKGMFLLLKFGTLNALLDNKQQGIVDILQLCKQPRPTISDLEWYGGLPWAKAEEALALALESDDLEPSDASDASMSDEAASEQEEERQERKRKTPDTEDDTSDVDAEDL